MGNPRLPDIETLRAMGFNPAQVDKLLAYIGKKNMPGQGLPSR